MDSTATHFCRLVGVTGASMAVTSAYIADVTPEAQRSRRYGHLGACFGIGFIIGPVIGGLLGAHWVRAPFLAATAMNAINLLLTLWLVKESHTNKDAAARFSFNPLASLRWVASFKTLLPLIGVYLVLVLVGEIGGTIWVLYGEDKFAWDALIIGISLAGFGAFHALAQAFCRTDRRALGRAQGDVDRHRRRRHGVCDAGTGYNAGPDQQGKLRGVPVLLCKQKDSAA